MVKNSVKKSSLLRLVALLAMVFVANIFSMQENSYFIYDQDNSENGIWVDKELVKKNSETLKNMIADLGEETNKISFPYSFNLIKFGFDFLDNKVDIRKFSFGQLVDVANFFNFLDVPADKMKIVLVKIKENIDKGDAKNINVALKTLHPDLQKLIMTEPAITYLKDCIIKKYAKDRGKSLVGHPDTVYSVAFNYDGTKIVSGCKGHQNNLILWDISNPHNIVYQTFVGHPSRVNSVAFNHDGTKIISGCDGNQNNLILWDISNPHNIVRRKLIGHPRGVRAVAFSHDGTKIVSGCYVNQNNLILWDISNLQNITQKTLVGHPDDVYAVAFSHDDTKIVSGCKGHQNNLILWDISNPDNITPKTLAGHPDNVTAVAFSHYDTKIVSGCWDDKNNLILWDISNPQNITQKPLVGHPDTVFTVAFSPDDTKIVSGCDSDHNNLILWDISNPDNIVQQILIDHPDSVSSAAFSPDGTKIVYGCYGDENNLIIWTLLTDQENTLLKQLKNYTVDQIRLIYQLCLQLLKGQAMALKQGSEEQEIFMTLPQDMQKLLTDLFAKSWFSGWW